MPPVGIGLCRGCSVSLTASLRHGQRYPCPPQCLVASSHRNIQLPKCSGLSISCTSARILLSSMYLKSSMMIDRDLTGEAQLAERRRLFISCNFPSAS